MSQTKKANYLQINQRCSACLSGAAEADAVWKELKFDFRKISLKQKKIGRA